jgi:hypothetical protein
VIQSYLKERYMPTRLLVWFGDITTYDILHAWISQSEGAREMSGQKHQPAKYTKKTSKKADSRLMQERGERRSGSDSDAHSGRKKSRLHEDHKTENAPLYDSESAADFSGDLHAHDRTGEDHGENQTLLAGAISADEIKNMHTILADLTDDELKNITILPVGTRLEQGAKYIDLRNLEQGEFVARSNMVADAANAFVPKKETDYLLWNRLNQVETPSRLDETSSE